MIDISNDGIEEGNVVKVRDFIIEVKGINDSFYFEKILIGSKGIGYVSEINKASIKVVLVRKKEDILVGDKVQRTKSEFKVLFSKDYIGNIVNIFGENLINNKTFENTKEIVVERDNISIMDRTPVERPLRTGIRAIDMLYPIGKGQRQLIIGEKKTGKTQIALDTITNQKDENIISFYVAVGKTNKEIKEIQQNLMNVGALNNTIIVAATNEELASVKTLTPYAALSMAEEYMFEGRDVLVVIDDLKAHADTYREISLLSDKTPGRDAYPPDIFYLHSRLLEKGCQHKMGGSITILPIVETKSSDITDYIPTNIISITDGQIVLSRKNFEKGQKPAINYGLSVSRLGGAVQTKSIKEIGNKIRNELLSYLETRDIYELTNEDELTPTIREGLKRGNILLSKMMQYKFKPSTEEEIIELFKEEYES